MSRVVLITGGTGGLGKSAVEKFLKSGDTVLIADIREADEKFKDSLGEYSKNLHSYKLNVLNEDELKEFSAKVKENFQGLDILVNVVGGFSMANVADTSEEELDKMIALNIKSAFFSSKVFLNQLTKSENGRIINISARSGLKGGAMVGAYSLSKAGLISFTESLAEELKDSSVTVNAVMPSIIDTEINRSSMPDADFSKWVSPEDLANVIFFLASREAKAISGAAIPVYNKA